MKLFKAKYYKSQQVVFNEACRFLMNEEPVIGMYEYAGKYCVIGNMMTQKTRRALKKLILNGKDINTVVNTVKDEDAKNMLGLLHNLQSVNDDAIRFRYIKRHRLRDIARAHNLKQPKDLSV